MPEYSYKALLNKKYLYDIIFFVEDKDKEYEYEILFNKIFDFRSKTFRIESMGGKKKVINAFYDNVEDASRTCLYLVDGDFDVILNRVEVHDNRFYYLKKYNIESYLFDKNGVLDFFRIFTRRQLSDIEHLLHYDMWYNNIIEKLSNLFFYFMFLSWLNLEKAPITVDKGLNYFINFDNNSIDDDKLTEFKNELEKTIMHEIPNYTEKYNEFYKLYHDKFFADSESYICGKYLLQSLYLHMCYVCKCNKIKQLIDKKFLKDYLIEKIDHNQFTELVSQFSVYI